MNRAKLNYWIDIPLAISFIIASITAMIVIFMPYGQGSGQLLFLGVTRHTYMLWHDISGLIMIILAVVHLLLHWNWLVCMTKGIKKK